MKKSARVRARDGERGGTVRRQWWAIREGGEREEAGVLWVFIISSSRLDSVKLWNNPLMSPPYRVDRMSTRLSDFSLFYFPALFLPRPSVSPSLYPLPFIFPLRSYASFHFPDISATLLFPVRGLTDATILIIVRLASLGDFAFKYISHGWFFRHGNKWGGLGSFFRYLQFI